MYTARANNISKYNHIVKKIKEKSEVKVFDMRLIFLIFIGITSRTSGGFDGKNIIHKRYEQ